MNLHVSQCLTKTDVYSLPDEMGVSSNAELYNVPFGLVGAAKARAVTPFPRSTFLTPLILPAMFPASIGLLKIRIRNLFWAFEAYVAPGFVASPTFKLVVPSSSPTSHKIEFPPPNHNASSMALELLKSVELPSFRFIIQKPYLCVCVVKL